jgi:hypothetical protein
MQENKKKEYKFFKPKLTKTDIDAHNSIVSNDLYLEKKELIKKKDKDLFIKKK